MESKSAFESGDVMLTYKTLVTKVWADSCCWVLREGGVLRGVISGHVDDFLFAGKSGDKLWSSKLEAIKAKFKWGAWDTGTFTQCGVVVKQVPEGIELSQPAYH